MQCCGVCILSKFKKKNVAEIFRIFENQHKNAELAKTQKYYPFITKDKRIIPSCIATSSLFAPVKSRQMHDATIIHSLSNTVIAYSGKRLDESQADAWMQLVYESRHQPAGSTIDLKRAEFLRAIGKTDGAANYKWLHSTLTEFANAKIIIETKKADGSVKFQHGKSDAFHMLEKFTNDDVNKIYNFKIDARWQAIFESQFSLIDWSVRLEINGAMAKALQRFISASSDMVQRNSLTRLMALFNYNGPVRKFRTAITLAGNELIRVGLVDKCAIEISSRGKEQLVLVLSEKVEEEG